MTEELKKLRYLIQEAWNAGEYDPKDKFGDFLTRAAKGILEAGYRLPAGKAPLLTDEQLLGIRAKINGTSNVIKFARSVSKLTSQAQNDADHQWYTGGKE